MSHRYYVPIGPFDNPVDGEWQFIHSEETPFETGRLVNIIPPEGYAICRVIEGEPVRADLLSACESALAMLDTLFPGDVFTGESGDPGAVLIAENRARLQAAIEKAKGEGWAT